MIWIFIVWYFGCFCEIYVNDLWSFSQHWQPSKIDSLFMYKIVKRTRWKIYHQSNQRQCPTRWHSNDAVTMQQGTCNKWTNRPIWRHRHTWTSPQSMQTPLLCNTRSTTVTQPWYHDHLKWKTWNTYYTKCFENFATEDEYNYHWENNHPVHCEMEMLSLWNGFRQALWTPCP